MARRVEMHADWDEFSGKALEQGEPDAADFS
jgi:glutamine synthetase type III